MNSRFTILVDVVCEITRFSVWVNWALLVKLICALLTRLDEYFRQFEKEEKCLKTGEKDENYKCVNTDHILQQREIHPYEKISGPIESASQRHD